MEISKTVWLEENEYENLIDFDMAASFLGCKGKILTDDMREDLREAADLLTAHIKPRYMFQVIRLSCGQKEGVLADFFAGKNLLLTGNSIREHLGGEEIAVAGCLTMGEGADEVIAQLQKESMLKAIFADALANAAVELLRTKLEKDAAKTVKKKLGWLFGIGYGDLPLGLQKNFLEAMGAKKIGLTATEKMILHPSKSVSGFLNVKKREEDKKNCNGKCGICPERERCHIFVGKH